jgi:hypothetical protein
MSLRKKQNPKPRLDRLKAAAKELHERHRVLLHHLDLAESFWTQRAADLDKRMSDQNV